jgi:hypothetical protein
MGIAGSTGALGAGQIQAMLSFLAHAMALGACNGLRL